MENLQPTKTGNELEKKAVILDVSTKSRVVAVTEPPASKSLQSKTTTATTLKGLPKTLTSAELQTLQSKLDLVAGALADFQSAKGRIVCKEETAVLPSGSIVRAVKIYLVADVGIVKDRTNDGLKFSLVAEAK